MVETPPQILPVSEGQKEPSIYDLQYLVYRLDLQREFQLTDLETKVISFILSYANISKSFYFSNINIGRIFDKAERSISRAIGVLEEKGLIQCEYKMKADGGQIRFIRLDKGGESNWTKMASPTRQDWLGNNNKINNNKLNIKYICSFEDFWELYPKKVSKKKSMDIYEKIVVSKDIEEKVMEGLSRYIKKWKGEATDIKYIPNPTTWLNQERWDDDVVVSNERYNKYARDGEKEWQEKKQREAEEYRKMYVDDGKGGITKLADIIKGFGK